MKYFCFGYGEGRDSKVILRVSLRPYPLKGVGIQRCGPWQLAVPECATAIRQVQGAV